jgi:hypothetical protein
MQTRRSLVIPEPSALEASISGPALIWALARRPRSLTAPPHTQRRSNNCIRAFRHFHRSPASQMSTCCTRAAPTASSSLTPSCLLTAAALAAFPRVLFCSRRLTPWVQGIRSVGLVRWRKYTSRYCSIESHMYKRDRGHLRPTITPTSTVARHGGLKGCRQHSVLGTGLFHAHESKYHIRPHRCR